MKPLTYNYASGFSFFFLHQDLTFLVFCILYKKKDVTLQSIMAREKNNELEKRNQAFLIYQDENGIARVNVRFEGEDVWLTVEQMMELFDASQQDISYHINQIYDDGEQDPNRTHKKFLLVRQEGTRSVRIL